MYYNKSIRFDAIEALNLINVVFLLPSIVKGLLSVVYDLLC